MNTPQSKSEIQTLTQPAFDLLKSKGFIEKDGDLVKFFPHETITIKIPDYSEELGFNLEVYLGKQMMLSGYWLDTKDLMSDRFITQFFITLN